MNSILVELNAIGYDCKSYLPTLFIPLCQCICFIPCSGYIKIPSSRSVLNTTKHNLLYHHGCYFIYIPPCTLIKSRNMSTLCVGTIIPTSIITWNMRVISVPSMCTRQNEGVIDVTSSILSIATCQSFCNNYITTCLATNLLVHSNTSIIFGPQQ